MVIRPRHDYPRCSLVLIVDGLPILNTGVCGETTRLGQVQLKHNPVTAMPSIHVAATAPLVFPARWSGHVLAELAIAYLGEHDALDLVAGGTLASRGWFIADRLLGVRQEQSDHRRRRVPELNLSGSESDRDGSSGATLVDLSCWLFTSIHASSLSHSPPLTGTFTLALYC